MKAIELIKVRTASANDKDGVRGQVEKLLGKAEMPGLMCVKAYIHTTFPEDICVVLKWDAEEALPKGTATGLALLENWKRFGLVDHAVWMEAEQWHPSPSNRLES